MIPYPPCVLPIELGSFSGKCLNGKTQLMWNTISELNNSFFTVEASEDGINFKAIGKVNGAGNSKQSLNYTFEVEERFTNSYFRLKQTDFNGHSDYSQIISVSCENFNSPITIYPNPNNGIFTLKGVELNTEIVVTNMIGEKVFSTKSNSHNTQIDLSFLEKGIYFINIVPFDNHQSQFENSGVIRIARKIIIQ